MIIGVLGPGSVRTGLRRYPIEAAVLEPCQVGGRVEMRDEVPLAVVGEALSSPVGEGT